MMFRIVVLSIMMGLHAAAVAQLLNPSFEQTDSSGSLANWKHPQGTVTKRSVVYFGAIPFTAFDGNYFAVLESDTTSLPIKAGILQQTAVFADTPKSISFQYLYLPENTSQHARLQLLFTKWTGSARDTVLFFNDTIPVIANGSSIPIQWNTYSRTLSPHYRNSIIPDSAWLRITNDESQTGKTIRLCIDDVRTGKWPVGLSEQQLFSFRVFPNPAHTWLTIQPASKYEQLTVRITSLSGQQLLTSTLDHAADPFELYTGSIPAGLYILQLVSGSLVSQQLMSIQH